MHLTLYFNGHLHNLKELHAELAIESFETEADEVRSLILAAWRRWGQNMPEHLLGDFAIVIEDTQSGETFLTRSPLGVKPLYYCILQGKLYHAFSPAFLKKICPKSLTPNQDWMALYILQLSADNRKTAYHEMFKVAPAHSLVINARGDIKEWRYHHWRNDAPITRKRDNRWVEEYRAVLEESIRCRMDMNAPMGTENSGGIDSGTITAYLAHFLGNPGNRLHSFGFAMLDQEPALILETSQAKEIVHNYIVSAQNMDEDFEAMINYSLSILGYPFEHGSGVFHTPFYRECQLRGIKTLFSGFGGDEGVTNSGQLLKYELLDTGRYANLWDILPGDPIRKSLRLIKTMTVSRQSPAYRPSFLNAWNKRWPHQPLRESVVERLNLYNIFIETARYDAPYRSINDFIINHLVEDPFVAARHENCTLMAESYGVDYRWPLWDVRLVQQYLSTPSIEKVGPDGIGRYLHRRAIDGVVPKQVAWKLTKDMGSPKILGQGFFNNYQLRSIEIIQKELDQLHPALDELIDREKIGHQITEALSSEKKDINFIFSFSRTVDSLNWLNQWLKC